MVFIIYIQITQNLGKMEITLFLKNVMKAHEPHCQISDDGD